MSLGERSYDITVMRGGLSHVGELFDLDRRIFILTDSGVPSEYAERVAAAAKHHKICTVTAGEQSKCLDTYGAVLGEMLSFGMGRGDALVAVGGGVVGDLGGFCAATYMRGIDFYNVPTTLLSQVDSSIGGKTAVDLGNVKNIVGAFHQPRGVLIDTEVLHTLPKRQIANGLAEAVKMATTSDARLFERLENEGFTDGNADEIVTAALLIKKDVVEKDERESGLRRILNFGHTLGHGIEADGGFEDLYHGECVALGMIPMIAEPDRSRLVALCRSLGLPMDHGYNLDNALSFAVHDKKCTGGRIGAIFCDRIGSCEIRELDISDFEDTVRRALKK